MKRIFYSLLLLFLLLPFLSWGQVDIVTGAEVLMSRPNAYWSQLEGRRVGVVANQTSVLGPQKTHLVDTLVGQGIAVKAIFCPEHGFRGQAEAGASVASDTDSRTGIPVVSLYGKTKKPTHEQLQDIDIVVFDLQDVGCRFYTYISTLSYVMEACVENGVPLMVLDRPNPNAHYVDGPVLEPQYQSFVGLHPVPVVYGMTIGEYAKMVLGEHWLWMTQQHNQWVRAKDYLQAVKGFKLTVVPLQNYTHHSRYVLPVAPSPNLQTPQAVALYPSLCLLEGANVSVGRGTDNPFEIVGSPKYVPSKSTISTRTVITFTPHRIKGVSENPPFKGQQCYGLDLRRTPVPAKFDIAYIQELHNNTPKYEFFLANHFFDKLAGTATLRLQLDMNMTEAAIRQSWAPNLDKFKKIRQKYLLYPE